MSGLCDETWGVVQLGMLRSDGRKHLVRYVVRQETGMQWVGWPEVVITVKAAAAAKE